MLNITHSNKNLLQFIETSVSSVTLQHPLVVGIPIPSTLMIWYFVLRSHTKNGTIRCLQELKNQKGFEILKNHSFLKLLEMQMIADSKLWLNFDTCAGQASRA